MTPADLDTVLARLTATHDDELGARDLALKELLLELDRTTEQLGDAATFEDYLVDVARRLTTLGYAT